MNLRIEQDDDVSGAVCIEVLPLADLKGLPDFRLWFSDTGVKVAPRFDEDDYSEEGPFDGIEDTFEFMRDLIDTFFRRTGLAPMDADYNMARGVMELRSRGLRVDLTTMLYSHEMPYENSNERGQ